MFEKNTCVRQVVNSARQVTPTDFRERPAGAFHGQGRRTPRPKEGTARPVSAAAAASGLLVSFQLFWLSEVLVATACFHSPEGKPPKEICSQRLQPGGGAYTCWQGRHGAQSMQVPWTTANTAQVKITWSPHEEQSHTC